MTPTGPASTNHLVDPLAVCLQVSCVGQMLCAVVADTRAHAKRGAAAVKISYEDLPDPVFTIEVCGVKRITWNHISLYTSYK